jgi:hypothetical protein
MEAIAITIVCVVVFLITRWGSKTFGRGAGTLIGLALMGWTAFGLIALMATVFGWFAALILPALVPLLIPLGMGFFVFRLLSRWSKQQK